MKFLYLLGSRLTLYFQKSKAVFLLFCFCGIATSLSFLFFYATLPSVRSRTSDSLAYREFTVTDILDGLSGDALIDLQSDPMVESVMLVHTGIEGEKKKIATLVNPDDSMNALMGTGSFKGADPYSVIVPHSPADPSEVRVGETMTIEGKEFQVIGTVAGGSGGSIWIPLETYLSMNLSTESACIDAASKADVDSGAMEAKLREVFGEKVQIAEDERQREFDEEYSQIVFKNLSVTYVAVILVFLFLFLQMVEETGKETAICRTFGATGGKVLLLHFCEVLLLTGGSALVGCLLHAALYKPLLSRLNPVDIPYYFGDYVIVFSVILGITLLVSIPYVIRCLFLSPKEATLTAAK